MSETPGPDIVRAGSLDSRLSVGCSMGHLLVRAIAAGGDEIAIRDSQRQVSYSAFGEALSTLIQVLKARGFRKGDPVGILSTNRIEAFQVTCAAFIMGLRVTSLHPMASARDQAFILRDADIDTVFFDPRQMKSRALELRDRIGIRTLFSLGPCEGLTDVLSEAEAFDSRPLVPEADAGDISNISYTGGTSGAPKGVVHTHRTRVTMTMTMLADWEWPAVPRLLVTTPISHASGAMIPPVLMRAGTVVLAEKFQPLAFCDLVARHRITSTFLVPTMIYKLLDLDRTQVAKLSSLEVVYYGAAAACPVRMGRARQRFGPIFMQMYGQTEAPNCITALLRRDHSPERSTSCGRPIGSSQVAILDERGHQVPDGEIGEICVRGPLLMSGYWNKKEETDAVFRDGCLHTGDLAYQDSNGFMYIVGRDKDLIISGGFNVYPREVEDALMDHPSVASAAVFGVEDATWGEAVYAVVVLKDKNTGAAELQQHVREQKGAIQAPKSVFFVDSIPTTALGKPDKAMLQRAYTNSTKESSATRRQPTTVEQKRDKRA